LQLTLFSSLAAAAAITAAIILGGWTPTVLAGFSAWLNWRPTL